MRLVHSKFELLQIFASLALAAGGIRMVAQGDSGGWGIAGFFGACALALAAIPLRRNRKPGEPSVYSLPSTRESLVIDDTGVRRDTGKIKEAVRWDELAEVWIITTDDGPFSEDVFFALCDTKGNGVLVAQGLASVHDLLRVLQDRLPTLDNEQIIRAMVCAENARFLIWQAPRA